MKEKVRLLGMDVRAETISVAVAEADGEVRSLRRHAEFAVNLAGAVAMLFLARSHQAFLLPNAG